MNGLPIHLETAEGRLVKLSNGLETPLKSCAVSFDFIQAGIGTPSLSNVRAITGRTGVSVNQCKHNHIQRIFGSQTLSGITFTVGEDGIVTLNGAATGGQDFWLNDLMSFPTGDYIYRCVAAPQHDGYHAYYYIDPWQEAGNDRGDGVVFTVRDSTKKYRFVINIHGTDCRVENVTMVPVVTPVEGYASTTMNWEATAGTLYGGIADPVTGVVRATKFGLNPADCTLTYATDDSSSYCVMIELGKNGLPRSVKTEDPNYCAASNRFARSNSGAGNMELYSGSIYLRIPKSEMSALTVAAAHDWFVSHQTVVVYTMETPVTYNTGRQTIKTAKGENNFWSDAGNIVLSYPKYNKTGLNATWNNMAPPFSTADYTVWDSNESSVEDAGEGIVRQTWLTGGGGYTHTVCFRSSPGTTVAGHIYYLSYMVNPAFDGAKLGVEFAGGQIVAYGALLPANQWSRLRFTAQVSSDDLTLRAYFANRRDGYMPVAGDSCLLKAPIYVDLTKMFGAGNEPDMLTFERQCARNGIDLTASQPLNISGTQVWWAT